MPHAILIDATTMEELRRDAARYRWLRSASVAGGEMDEAGETWESLGDALGEKFDDIIDRARSAPPDDEHHDRIKIMECNTQDDEERQIDNRERAGDINKER